MEVFQEGSSNWLCCDIVVKKRGIHPWYIAISCFLLLMLCFVFCSKFWWYLRWSRSQRFVIWHLFSLVKPWDTNVKSVDLFCGSFPEKSPTDLIYLSPYRHLPASYSKVLLWKYYQMLKLNYIRAVFRTRSDMYDGVPS